MSYTDALKLPSRTALEELQLTKLQRVLAEIYPRNRLYKEKFDEAGIDPRSIRSTDDIARLPLTEKRELVADQDNGHFAANMTYPLSRYIRFHQTSGTTGEPLRVLDTRESWDWWGHCWKQVFSAVGVSADDRIFCAFSFGPFIGFWAAVEGARQLGAMLIPGGGRSSLERLKLMRETGCTVLCCTPSYALHLLDVAVENDFDLSKLKIHTTIHAGEPGANIPSIKQRIEAGWSAKCRDHSGASEVGAYGFEANAQPNGLLINETEFIAEVLNAEGRQVKPGEEGELVLTNLGRWGFPVIRYRTGDVVRYVEPQAATRYLLYLEGGIMGRMDDMVTVRGVNIYPSAIENLVRSLDEIDEYRTTVTSSSALNRLTMEIEVSRGADRVATQISLTELITDKLGLLPDITVVEPETLPRFEMKGKRFFIEKQ